ncbi:DEAD/DEAH box helicase [Fusobacterium polymorphum]|uniref:Helicase C-terminal domain-containing protein n=1 Tax=Fusobacterium nucleatum CTI-6 TaxID=1316587 RepID=U7TVG0_FUSNU|nr:MULTISPECIES: DEAD/DEAH box helicase [Fusobacterium]ERT47411.1 hypothetical protein HMPREF1767_01413 [Fusobacterium nucleatum CTI-6]OFO26125.1 hypothetical protein HMPREF3051_11180 [Fusobacterium sp. HMSC064B11]WCB32918.1 DEAD/DEAH box helicase [Fusobacterium nucleatum]
MWLIKAHTSQEAPTSKSESSSPKASVVIHLDPWWNISAQNQATDRAHRIGQEDTVQVFNLITKNTIEEKIQNLQNKKKELSDIFVENSKGSFSSLTKEELFDLFKLE